MKTNVKLKAIIGFGTIGKTLHEQLNNEDIKHNVITHKDVINNNVDYNVKYDEIFVCAASGTKWKANLEPDKDKLSIENVFETVKNFNTKLITLISTIDVRLNQPYGENRLYLENLIKDYCEKHNINYKIIRLPMIIGKYIIKNVYYDAQHPELHDLTEVAYNQILRCRQASMKLNIKADIGMYYLTPAHKRFVVFDLRYLYKYIKMIELNQTKIVYTIESITAAALVKLANSKIDVDAYIKITRDVYSDNILHYDL